MSSILVLDDLLMAFGEDLKNEDVTEISVNKPEEYFIALKGTRDMVRKENPKLTYALLKDLAQNIATNSHQEISNKKPLLSAQIESPDHEGLFYRIQIVHDPAVSTGSIALSIRKPSILSLSYDQYEPILNSVEPFAKISAKDQELMDLYSARNFHEFIRKAVQYEKNIIISAGTGSGKTTFFNSIISDCIPLGERLITIEDAKELRPPHPNTLQLYYSRGDQGLAKVTAQSLMEACLRLYPKRILLGEIRGSEAFTYLNLISSGHGGSIATLHANDPVNAIERLTLMVLMAGTTLTSDQVKMFVNQSIDIIVQLGRTESGGYGCSSIYFKAYEDMKNEKNNLSNVA